MRKPLIATAIAAVLASSVATARGDARDTTFSGPFVGAQFGLGRRTIDAFNVDQRRDGLDYGAFAGADIRLGSRVVAGAEGDIGNGGRTLDRDFGLAGRTRIDPGFNWSVSGRAGVLANPRLLIYGRLGYGREKLRATFSNSNPSLFRTTADGLLYGGGAEYALGRRFSLRAEYRHSDFDGRYNPQQALFGAAFRF